MNVRQRNTGLAVFFLNGLGAISSGIVVSVLRERYGFAYGLTGTLLALMNIGNLVAGFAAGVLPGKIGLKKTALLLPAGYAVGYCMMGFTSFTPLLMISFFMLGLAKGCTINLCTVMVGENSKNRTTGMNLMHSCYACGALLCPFVIAASGNSTLALALGGAALWGLFALTPPETRESVAKKSGPTDWSFLRSVKFWLLTGLLFCQNATEISVTGWLVTYFKDSGLITPSFSPYTVTVMWTATLIARLLIAFVIPLKNPRKAMIVMGAGCIVFYFGLMQARSQWAAVALLFAFAFAMAGMNPTAVASAGRMTNITSMGVMLPTASLGAILMPWVIGLVAERFGIAAGMACNLAPCVGMMTLAWLVSRLPED